MLPFIRQYPERVHLGDLPADIFPVLLYCLPVLASHKFVVGVRITTHWLSHNMELSVDTAEFRTAASCLVSLLIDEVLLSVFTFVAVV